MQCSTAPGMVPIFRQPYFTLARYLPCALLWVAPGLLAAVCHAGSLGAGPQVSVGAPDRPAPVFTVRELYAPGHFGNSYEVLGANEMRGVLAAAVHWGFNGYGDWFDMDDCKDPFSAAHTYGLGNALWDRKRVNFRSAAATGLACDLIVTPNHVYEDQCLPDLLATTGGRVFGQLVCPSKPAARKCILEDYENLFADAARAGVHLTSLNAAPYDFGGCLCLRCKPWILTFARLTHEIHTIAQRYHPGIQMNMIGWWWSVEEHKLLADWVDQHAPGWVTNMFLHIPYGKTKVADVRLPKGCRRCAFVHIGYADQASPRDTYGHFGPVIAADRLEKTVADLRAQGVTGWAAYSEGVSDDVNKAILAGLSAGKFRTADEVLRAYAVRYFGTDERTAGQWAAWLKQWGRPFDVDTRQSGRALAALLKKTPRDNWRRRQWELKQQLFQLHAKINRGTQWTPTRLAAVEEFWAVQEDIHRGLWGLAPPRHIFARRFTPLPWYQSWARYMADHAAAGTKTSMGSAAPGTAGSDPRMPGHGAGRP